MTRKRAQRLLIIAFAISLLIHLIFAVSLHPRRGREANEVEVVSIQHRPLAMTQLQTPPPPPKATPIPQRRLAQRPAPRKMPATSASGGGRGPAVATPAPIQTAAPRATASAPGCEKSDVDAAITQEPSQPQIPSDVRADGTSGVASVEVRLDDRGDVTTANVSQSTGNSSLDVVALSMAREARYSPALHACKPVAASYTFRVRFYAW